VPPPTTPPKLTVPVPCAMDSVWAPSTVEVNPTLLLVVVSVVAAARVTAPV